ncbi:transposase, partial [Xenorhabdus sp. Sc-CR9]
MRKVYTSDISREVFMEIEPLLLSKRKRTRPRKVDVYEVFCAL